jgi:hypothetical protein
MKAYLATYVDEGIGFADLVEISDSYNGDPYGDDVPVAVGSNQTIVTQDDARWQRCVELAALGALTPEQQYELEMAEAMQPLIDDGSCWRMEGAMGRQAMAMIERGLCVLGATDHTDYYGNHVPSRTQVQAGTKGSVEYANQQRAAEGLPLLDPAKLAE